MATKKKVYFRGLNKVMKNLNEEIQKIENRSAKGLIHAAIIPIRDSETKTPKVPVKYGNLRASRFVVSTQGEERIPGQIKASFEGKNAGTEMSRHAMIVSKSRNFIKTSKKPLVVLGYSANYAAFVHETDKKVNWTRTGSGAKFLEAHLRSNSDEMIKTIKKYAKIK